VARALVPAAPRLVSALRPARCCQYREQNPATTPAAQACVRLSSAKAKQKSAETNLGAAGTSARATSNSRGYPGKMLILASTSPRRRELLAAAGIAFEVREPTADETRLAYESPIDYVLRVAREKAISITALPGDIVLGADTIVCLEGEVLGKPRNRDDARRMLRSLSGRSHWVYTGFCLVSDSRSISDSAATEVLINDLSNEEIEDYLESGEPLDKAGAYAIQGLASKFVREIRGCYHNVVGLPVSRIYRHLRAWSS